MDFLWVFSFRFSDFQIFFSDFSDFSFRFLFQISFRFFQIQIFLSDLFLLYFTPTPELPFCSHRPSDHSWIAPCVMGTCPCSCDVTRSAAVLGAGSGLHLIRFVLLTLVLAGLQENLASASVWYYYFSSHSMDKHTSLKGYCV